MPVEVCIPSLGESVTEGVIARWLKADGDVVATDEGLLELETDKASVEVPSPAAGVITILKPEGATVQVGEVVARLNEMRGAAATAPAPRGAEAVRGPAPAGTSPAAPAAAPPLSPAVRRMVEEHGVDAGAVKGSGRGGRLTKADVLQHLEARPATPAPTVAAPAPAPVRQAPGGGEDQERVAMSRVRQRIAERLVQAQHTAAILTTFNEIDMTAVLALRARYKERFAEVHGVRLGFMSFFARACAQALVEMPLVNAQIDGTHIVYNRRVHLGVAVGTERGLIVPVIRNADQMSFADLEREIERLAGLARDNKLMPDDFSGGTFTISNGGVYGSLLSTPILNPPQSAILGMHKIEARPVVADNQIVIRSMMYVALSYDHRLVDGADAVTFLVRVKERLEDPSRLLLEV